MGLFNFFKPKKNDLQSIVDHLRDSNPEIKKNVKNMLNSYFPMGVADYNAGIDELLHILNNKISRKKAMLILVKSVIISRISQPFDKERLRLHLSGYCLNYFTENQLDMFLRYLTVLATVNILYNASPSEVKRDGETYYW
jgi:hypothetical protein